MRTLIDFQKLNMSTGEGLLVESEQFAVMAADQRSRREHRRVEGATATERHGP